MCGGTATKLVCLSLQPTQAGFHARICQFAFRWQERSRMPSSAPTLCQWL
jgi:hypothetical protein